jgi:hypothetical protein
MIMALFLCACFSLTACSSSSSSDGPTEIRVHEMISFSKAKENALKTIADPEEIEQIEKTFHNAKKQSGIVDVTDPQYKVDLENESYFLWFNKDGTAVIMNTKDTHTIFKIDSADELEEMIQN